MTLENDIKSARRQKLVGIGLSEKAIEQLHDSTRGNFVSEEDVDLRITHLIELGFKQPV